MRHGSSVAKLVGASNQRLPHAAIYDYLVRMTRIVFLVMVFGTAAMAASVVAALAHDGLGIAPEIIRTDALVSAGIAVSALAIFDLLKRSK
jgi:hypothetical protein